MKNQTSYWQVHSLNLVWNSKMKVWTRTLLCRRGRLFGAILSFGGVVSLRFPRLAFCMDFQLFPFSEDIRLRWSPEISGTRLSESLVQSIWSNLLRWVKTALLGNVFFFVGGECDVHRRKLLIQSVNNEALMLKAIIFFHRFLDWQHLPQISAVSLTKGFAVWCMRQLPCTSHDLIDIPGSIWRPELHFVLCIPERESTEHIVTAQSDVMKTWDEQEWAEAMWVMFLGSVCFQEMKVLIWDETKVQCFGVPSCRPEFFFPNA